MKKFLAAAFSLWIMGVPVKMAAQGIGINNPTPATSALLDLTSTNKGFLVPRMTSVERLAIATPATGLLIYETTTNQFFYFDGVVWRSLVGDNKGWLLSGNAGTSDITNFIGTTDNVALNFRVNGLKAGKVDHINRNAMLGMRAGNGLVTGSTNNVFIGDSAGFQISNSDFNTVVGAGAMSSTSSGSGNTIMGNDAGKNNTGSGNVIIGSTAGRANTGSVNTFVGAFSGDLSSGSFNSFFGQFSGRNATSGLGNTLIGQSSGQSLGSGKNNSLLGWRAGLTLSSGSYNTLLGDSANVSVGNLINATAIGSKAMVGSSNSMVLGSIAGINGATANTNVGIGISIPSASAALDITSASRGMLVPRVLLSATNVAAPVTAPATSLLVYNLASAGVVPNNVTPGFYYWDGSKWVRFVDTIPSDDWSLTGNTGTSSVTDFIGTTDNVPLNFRVNNFKSGSIDHLNHNTTLGQLAGGSPALSGAFNVFIGDSAGVSNTAGTSNTLIGFRAGRNVVTSARNTVLGSKTAEFMTGSDNVVIGAESALALTSASNNVIIGSSAAQNIASMGSSNVLIGKSAPLNPNTTGSFNVVIGESAGANNASLTQNNTIIGRLGRIESAIGGSTASDITILGANAVAQDQPQLGVSKITLLGTNTRSLNTTNATAIGANAAVGGNNMLVLGSINGTNGATASVNVGIGTINPARRFHIANAGFSGATSNASAGFVFESNANNYMHLLIPDANETGFLFGDPTTPLSSGILYNTAVAPNGLVFRTGVNVTRVTINAAGNVGIGTSNPTERLMVVGNIDASDDLYTGSLNGIINCGGGNMNTLINMIADLTPTPLNVNGDEDLFIEDDLELGSQGFKPGGGSWAAASDARLKKDVSDFTDGLQQVLQIRPVKFKYNDHFKSLNNGKEYIGVIAQEIKEVAPYTVELTQFGEQHMEDENGVEKVVKEGEAFYSYDSSALTYMLINGMKEQQKEIEDLKKLVMELQQQINTK